MNANRRKQIKKVIKQLDDLKAEIEGIKNDEEEYRDNIPDNLINSERYEIADNACDNLDSSIDTIDELIDYLTSVIE